MNCQQATQKLEALQLLRTELGNTLVLLKDAHNQTIAGGMTNPLRGEKEKREEVIQTLKTKARAIKQELETGIKEMNREILMFAVSDAINPYREGLIEAGLPIDHPECKEKKEMTLNMEQIVEEHIQHYKDQNMPEWAEDIEENEELLIDILLDENEKDKIEKRIKEGMIPIVMPSRETQQRTWKQSLENLKPIWIENGEEITLKPTNIYKEGYDEKMTTPSSRPVGTSEGTTTQSFFDSIPDRPYIVWVKPTQSVEKTNPEWKTTGLNFEEQQKKLATLHTDHPDLVNTVDIIPTEYATLQSKHTREIQKQIAEHNPNKPAQNIRPLDYWEKGSYSYTRFLSTGLFSDDDAPCADFSQGGARLDFDGGGAGARLGYGFRPAART